MSDFFLSVLYGCLSVLAVAATVFIVFLVCMGIKEWRS